MRRHKWIQTATLAAILAASLGAGHASQSQRVPLKQGSRSFPARPGGKLVLDLKTGGSVEVTGWERNQIEVSVTDRQDCDNCEIELVQTSSGLRIETSFMRTRRVQSSDVSISVRVPARFDVELDSMGGSFKVSKLNGTIEGETMGGDLEFSELSGRLEVSTMGGDITLTNSEVDGRVSTMGGDVLFEHVRGDIRGKSMGGDVTYRDVTNTRDPDRSVGEEVVIETMGGDIRVPEAPNGARVRTMGGDIRIGPASDFVTATTMGGDIFLEAVDGDVEVKTYGGKIDATVVGAGGDISMTSLAGGLTLTLPRNFSGIFEVELAYTQNSSRNFQIESDFVLQVEESPDWDYSRGSPRRYIYGRGLIKSGTNRVVLKTINGNIKIRSR